MKTIQLLGVDGAGRVALVDDGDYDLVSQYRWFPYYRPHNRTLYAQCHNIRWQGKTRSFLMHQIITGWARTDHKDHDGLNNQRSNLRPVTVSQNGANMQSHRDSTSSFKGVSWNSARQTWRASIQYQYRRRELGSFTSEEAAARAYDSAAREMMGEWAHLNFPDTGGLLEAG